MSDTVEQVVASRTVYSGTMLDVRVETVQRGEGRPSQREIVVPRGAVAMVAIDEQGQALFVRQYRSAIHRELLEIPAGTLNPGEPPDDCARRELAEEVNLQAARWTPLAAVYSSPGFCTEMIHLYLAEGLSHADGQPDEGEELTVVRLPLSDTLSLIASGKIQDAKTTAGLLLALEVRRTR